jgi:hypothetical protein
MSSIDIRNFRDTPYLRGFVFVGQAFTANHTFVIAAETTQWVQFTTGNGRHVHGIRRKLTPDKGNCTFVLYEAPTIVTPGTGSITIANQNRDSSKTSDASYLLDPIVTGGTEIDNVFMPGSTGLGISPAVGTSSLDTVEREYKHNTEYAFKIVNQTDEILTIQYSFTWYESGN